MRQFLTAFLVSIPEWFDLKTCEITKYIAKIKGWKPLFSLYFVYKVVDVQSYEKLRFTTTCYFIDYQYVKELLFSVTCHKLLSMACSTTFL